MFLFFALFIWISLEQIRNIAALFWHFLHPVQGVGVWKCVGGEVGLLAQFKSIDAETYFYFSF